MRKIAWLVAVATLLATGSYVFVYLYRWEWHRALLVGVLFLAAEVAVGIALVLRRLGPREPTDDDAAEESDAFTAARPDRPASSRDHFAWLRGDAGFGVFVPVLLGSGVIVSAIAWLVERVAARATRRSAADSVAERLVPLAFPSSLLVEHPELSAPPAGGDRPDVALLVRPHGDRR